MPPADGVMSQGDRIQLKPPMVAIQQPQQQQLPMMSAAAAASEAFAKDAIIAWFRGEFAAANAIIDALCGHLTQLEGGATKTYGSAFAAIHRRRYNWIPILQMQKFYSIADVTLELEKVVGRKRAENEEDARKVDAAMIIEKEEQNENANNNENENEKDLENPIENCESDGGKAMEEDFGSEITDSGSQEVHSYPDHITICSNHDECETRRPQFKMTKGFVAKEPVKGHTVNVVRGLKLYEDIFTDVELSKLYDFVNELRVAGQNGELSGETFIIYNQQKKGSKRELIQLGVPIFGQIKEDGDKYQKSRIEPIPPLLQNIVDHLIQWRLLPQERKPNGCIINFFDEGEYSHPFLKPPHLEQPISTLLLSESTMAFGHTLTSDGEGNYRAPLTLCPKEGSLLVMRGNSADTARHVMCSSPNKRASVTFFKLRGEIETSPNHPSSKAMTLWQGTTPQAACTIPNKFGPMTMIPKWGILRAPMVMLAPVRPVALYPKRIDRGGTGVFLPWGVGSRKHARHLPPRAQRRRLLALPSPGRQDATSESGANSSS
ncbi:RNA demethylase ALKBH10B-like [Andrographis paniculata]|uniref:RNA demethylase ALKBH10B-like n=1 Tax=Andrographis paniculata TaxID=175694 RepID=UPI0021E896AB|nr:RNA demethylase ALKBH10B-like [Andrographis paniculata]